MSSVERGTAGTPPLRNIDRNTDWHVLARVPAPIESFAHRLPSWRRALLQMSHSFSGALPHDDSVDEQHDDA
jgi:hypothetical protein